MSAGCASPTPRRFSIPVQTLADDVYDRRESVVDGLKKFRAFSYLVGATSQGRTESDQGVLDLGYDRLISKVPLYERLVAVREWGPPDHPQFVERVVFEFEASLIVLEAIADTDEIRTSFPVEPLSLPQTRQRHTGLEGASLGAFWECRNSKGYDDLVILAFRGPTPSLAVVCEASQLHLLTISRAGFTTMTDENG